MITFQNVVKRYEEKLVLDHLTLSLPDQGFVCITGSSGIGKTTIFNLLLGLTKPDGGIVQIEKSCICSAVFQEDRLLPWESVLQNVMLPGADRDRAVTILTKLGLGDELDTKPSQLSGGMARRVSIARALAVDADLYLMDEPTKGLDDTTRRSVLQTIHQYTDLAIGPDGHSLGKLLLMITHNPEETEGAQVIRLGS